MFLQHRPDQSLFDKSRFWLWSAESGLAISGFCTLKVLGVTMPGGVCAEKGSTRGRRQRSSFSCRLLSFGCQGRTCKGPYIILQYCRRCPLCPIFDLHFHKSFLMEHAILFRGLRPEAGNAGSRGYLSHILSFVAHTCARLSPLQKLDLLKKREREREFDVCSIYII